MEDVLEHAGVRLDLYRHQAFVDGREVHLTPTEFRLLEQFLRRPGGVWQRCELADAALRAAAPARGVRAVDQQVKALRRKLGGSSRIQTVWGVGYRIP